VHRNLSQRRFACGVPSTTQDFVLKFLFWILFSFFLYNFPVFVVSIRSDFLVSHRSFKLLDFPFLRREMKNEGGK
jgi:hypothetical protein